MISTFSSIILDSLVEYLVMFGSLVENGGLVGLMVLGDPIQISYFLLTEERFLSCIA